MADLWPALATEMRRVRVGLLGVQGSSLPPAPMLHLLDEPRFDIWFLAEADTDLVKAVAAGGTVGVYTVTGSGHDLWASLAGPIEIVADRRGLERVWSDRAEAQFPGGLGDIEWTPLRLSLREASIWNSPDSALEQEVPIRGSVTRKGIALAARSAIRF